MFYSALISFTQPLKRVWVHVKPNRRIKLIKLIVLMVLVSIAEVISIGAVLPFLGVLTNPELVYQSSYSQPIIHALGVSDPQQLLLPVTIIFILATPHSYGRKY